ncbi:uncharacterized protein PV06_03042 [Exophiala oligosperma]|uniref:Uncharacterized protein n=1 Tax=Exophiala oligosperma TaxID=215243 RepID=A0A0D2DP37_9EURO|nr:uncharacterized protein PV06_03042 [Exophiala oligosperma]KIW44583.1 hypothetical protein PV06_03042 [Exophiala oligosperma]
MEQHRAHHGISDRLQQADPHGRLFSRLRQPVDRHRDRCRKRPRDQPRSGRPRRCRRHGLGFIMTETQALIGYQLKQPVDMLSVRSTFSNSFLSFLSFIFFDCVNKVSLLESSTSLLLALVPTFMKFHRQMLYTHSRFNSWTAPERDTLGGRGVQEVAADLFFGFTGGERKSVSERGCERCLFVVSPGTRWLMKKRRRTHHHTPTSVGYVCVCVCSRGGMMQLALHKFQGGNNRRSFILIV